MRERAYVSCVHWGLVGVLAAGVTEITMGRTEENHISLTTTKHCTPTLEQASVCS